MDHTPVYIDIVPWVGDGPTYSENTSLSDQDLGEMVMVSGMPSIMPARAYVYPYAPKVIEFARVPLYPMDWIPYGQTPAIAAVLDYPTQDGPMAATPYAGSYTDLPLGAPAIPNGNAAFIGRGQ